MVSVAQLVRASGCGPEGRGFKSHRSPTVKKPKFQKTNPNRDFKIGIWILLFGIFYWPHRLMVRTSPFHGGNRGSNPLGVTRSRSIIGTFFLDDQMVPVPMWVLPKGLLWRNPLGVTITSVIFLSRFLISTYHMKYFQVHFFYNILNCRPTSKRLNTH